MPVLIARPVNALLRAEAPQSKASHHSPHGLQVQICDLIRAPSQWDDSVAPLGLE